MKKYCIAAVFNFLILVFVQSVVASQQLEKAGKLVFARGIVSSLDSRGVVTILARGDTIYIGQTIQTGKDSRAILKLLDGSQISLTENSRFVVEAFSVKDGKQQAELKLLEGGLRSITGFINKNRRNNFRLKTPNGSIGIRGTDFSVMICKENCEFSENQDSEGQSQQKSAVKGRIVTLRGEVRAVNKAGSSRLLYKQSPIYQGDTIITAEKSFAVIVFKDNTRTTLQANSQLRVDTFKLAKKTPENSKADFKLLKGSLRFLTGKIGKLNRKAYKIHTPNSSIGIRGTGFDLFYEPPPELSVWLSVWEGAVNFYFNDNQEVVASGKAIHWKSPKKPEKIADLPARFKMEIRPDAPEIDALIDMQELFGAQKIEGKKGLYMHVFHGEIDIQNRHLHLNLGAGETGYMGDDRAYRLTTTPDFLLSAFIPPDSDEQTLRELEILSIALDQINYYDDGLICEIK